MESHTHTHTQGQAQAGGGVTPTAKDTPFSDDAPVSHNDAAGLPAGRMPSRPSPRLAAALTGVLSTPDADEKSFDNSKMYAPSQAAAQAGAFTSNQSSGRASTSTTPTSARGVPAAASGGKLAAMGVGGGGGDRGERGFATGAPHAYAQAHALAPHGSASHETISPLGSPREVEATPVERENISHDEMARAESLALLRATLERRRSSEPGTDASAPPSPPKSIMVKSGVETCVPPGSSIVIEGSSATIPMPIRIPSVGTEVTLSESARIQQGIPVRPPLGRDVLVPRNHVVYAPHPSTMVVEEVDVTAEAAFQRISITGPTLLSGEQREACRLLRRALDLRDKHAYRKPPYYWGPYLPDQFPFSPKSRPPPVESGHLLRGGAAGRNTHVRSTPTMAANSSEGSLTRPSPTNGGRRRSLVGASPALPAGAPAPQAILTEAGSNGQEGPVRRPSIPPTPTLGATTRIDPITGRVVTGSKLVTMETGKEYGNLFYRRRPEPTYHPFTAPDAEPVIFDHKMVNGVMHVYDPALAAVKPAPSATGTPVPTPVPAAHLSDGPSSMPTVTPYEAEGTPAYWQRDVEMDTLFPVPSWEEYRADYNELVRIIHTPLVKTFAFRRLELLEARYHLHVQLNSEKESAESKAVPHRDFYNVRKVDTHVHHSACMNQKHLLRFIKHKLKRTPDEVVLRRDGKELTLAQVFESLHLTAYDLSVDTLDMHADWSTFHRFDRFNLKYNPVGQSRLREIFLKTDNFIRGRYLAELTKEVFDDLENSKYCLAEYRVSIYGKSRDEWSKLAAWVVDNKLASPNVRWMIQIPRLYETYKETGAIASFQDMLENIFMPLFDITRDPNVDPKLHQFLALVVGFDAVDDESRQELHRDAMVPPPAGWRYKFQPPYYYWTYYLSANLAALNQYRAARGMTEFSFRPHAGEAGDVDHLAATFLTAESINHGINLRKSPSLQYLYYLAQVGLAVSPLSNNRLFVEYNKNPFYEFFSKGLNVSLSTDDPLMLAYTKEPLLEEYCVAAQVWKLTNVDMCEIARNSVLQSGFEYPFKVHFVGPNYAEPGPAGSDIHMTNVPYIRLQFRLEILEAEHALLEEGMQPVARDAHPMSPSARPIPMLRQPHVHAHHEANRAHAVPSMPGFPPVHKQVSEITTRHAGGQLPPSESATFTIGPAHNHGRGAAASRSLQHSSSLQPDGPPRARLMDFDTRPVPPTADSPGIVEGAAANPFAPATASDTKTH